MLCNICSPTPYTSSVNLADVTAGSSSSPSLLRFAVVAADESGQGNLFPPSYIIVPKFPPRRHWSLILHKQLTTGHWRRWRGCHLIFPPSSVQIRLHHLQDVSWTLRSSPLQYRRQYRFNCYYYRQTTTMIG